MFFACLRHRAAWLVWAALSLAPPAFAQETVDWSEDAVLRDGRSIAVRIQGNSTAQPFYLAHQKSKLSQFRLTFQHPDTGENIVWQGARYFEPLLLDFVDGAPYLVVYGRPTQASVSQYGCPELPYIYLRHGAGGWQPVPLEQAPTALVRANLSTHDMAVDNAGRHFSADEVAKKIDLHMRESQGLVQKQIPRSLAGWNTDQKASAVVDRVVGDCRAPRPTLAALSLPPAVDGNTSVLESSEYVPEKALDGGDWNALMTDPQRAGACTTVFQRVTLENYQADLHFAQDPKARKRVPYARSGVLDPSIQVLCDDRVWFIRDLPDSEKITITQTTRAGDLVFHTAFFRPRSEPGFSGALRLPSLRTEAGYVYFDWMLSRNAGSQKLLKRSLSLRAPASLLTP